MRKEELRAWKEWERACRAAMKADEERKRREGKEKVKREKVLEKYVFSGRPMTVAAGSGHGVHVVRMAVRSCSMPEVVT